MENVNSHSGGHNLNDSIDEAHNGLPKIKDVMN